MDNIAIFSSCLNISAAHDVLFECTASQMREHPDKIRKIHAILTDMSLHPAEKALYLLHPGDVFLNYIPDDTLNEFLTRNTPSILKLPDHKKLLVESGIEACSRDVRTALYVDLITIEQATYAKDSIPFWGILPKLILGEAISQMVHSTHLDLAESCLHALKGHIPHQSLE